MQVQSLYHRRGAHVDYAGVQCVVEDVGRAAGTYGVYLGYDRSAQVAADDFVKMYAI